MEEILKIIERDSLEVAFLALEQKEITELNNHILQQEAKNLISKFPLFAKAYVQLGWIQLFNREYADAEKNLKIGLELDPNNGDAYYCYLYFLVEVNRFEEAENFVSTCLKIRSINTRLIYEELDCLLTQTERFKEALNIKLRRIPNLFDLKKLSGLENEIDILKCKLNR